MSSEHSSRQGTDDFIAGCMSEGDFRLQGDSLHVTVGPVVQVQRLTVHRCVTGNESQQLLENLRADYDLDMTMMLAVCSPKMPM